MTNDKLHNVAMEQLQSEWATNNVTHKKQRQRNFTGIRSSQISALVKYLIEIGLINENNIIEQNGKN